MSKILYCFKSLKPIEVQDDRAIAKLHPDYDTPENREEMLNTPVKQLLARQTEGLQKALSQNTEATKTEIQQILESLTALKEQVDALNKQDNTERVLDEVKDTNKIQVNEFGEIV